MPTIFVTGGAGYIGSHCCKEFARRGWRVVTFDNLSRGWRDMVRWGPLIEGDICDQAALNAAVVTSRPDLIAHFAGVAYVGESVNQPEPYYRINTGGTFNLLEVMRRRGIGRLIFSSTCATYGEPNEAQITEQVSQLPINPYGRSKLLAENLIKDYASLFPISYAILRYFNVGGASPDGDIGERHDPEPHIIPLALRSATENISFTIYGSDFNTRDGTCIRDYIHVMDLARAHAQSADRLLRGKDSFVANLGAGAGVTVREMLEAVESITGRSLIVKVGPRRPGDPGSLVSSIANARELLDWNPVESAPLNVVGSAWKWASKDAVPDQNSKG